MNVILSIQSALSKHTVKEIISRIIRSGISKIIAIAIMVSSLFTSSSCSADDRQNNNPFHKSQHSASDSSWLPNDKLKNDLLTAMTLIDHFDSASYRQDLDDIWLEAALFSHWRKLVTQGDTSTNHQIVQLSSSLREKLQALQVLEYPVLRIAYAEMAHILFSQFDVVVSVMKGTGNTIAFTSAHFSTEENVKIFREAISNQLSVLRFKKLHLKSSKEDVGKWFKLESPGDGEVGV